MGLMRHVGSNAAPIQSMSQQLANYSSFDPRAANAVRHFRASVNLLLHVPTPSPPTETAQAAFWGTRPELDQNKVSNKDVPP